MSGTLISVRSPLNVREIGKISDHTDKVEQIDLCFTVACTAKGKWRSLRTTIYFRTR